MNQKQNLIYFISSTLLTILILRLFLYFNPFFNLNISSINIHHLYTGTIWLVIAAIFFINNITNKYTIIAAGIGTGLITDELIYLIATDGSDSAYLTSISVYGMLILTAITILITLLVYYYKNKKRR